MKTLREVSDSFWKDVQPSREWRYDSARHEKLWKKFKRSILLTKEYQKGFLLGILHLFLYIAIPLFIEIKAYQGFISWSKIPRANPGGHVGSQLFLIAAILWLSLTVIRFLFIHKKQFDYLVSGNRNEMPYSPFDPNQDDDADDFAIVALCLMVLVGTMVGIALAISSGFIWISVAFATPCLASLLLGLAISKSFTQRPFFPEIIAAYREDLDKYQDQETEGEPVYPSGLSEHEQNVVSQEVNPLKRKIASINKVTSDWAGTYVQKCQKTIALIEKDPKTLPDLIKAMDQMNAVVDMILYFQSLVESHALTDDERAQQQKEVSKVLAEKAKDLERTDAEFSKDATSHLSDLIAKAKAIQID